MAIVALALIAGALLTWTTYRAAQSAPALAVFDVAPPAAPPEPAREAKPGPKQQRKERSQPQAQQPRREPPVVRMPIATAPPATVAKPAPDPDTQVKETTAPEAKPVPPAPQSSNAVPTWQGQVLAALNKVRRYPRDASLRRQQGVPYIRFVMDRDGRVLSSRLERPSGIRSLDSEAMSLPKRAEPLPRPPEEVRGNTIELVVPVEFFMH
ncbi:TonB family protein [Sphingomonas sp. 2R-10]|nr:TonB family protein [Sphingomonas sp. 2R-10]